MSTTHESLHRSTCYRDQFRNAQKSVWKLLRGCLLTLSSVAIVGCAASPDVWTKTVGNDTIEIEQVSAKLDAPTAEIYPTTLSSRPMTADRIDEAVYENISLDHVFRTALTNSTVLRDLGGVVITNPDNVQTRFTGAITETDPRFGMEAALSAFDAQLTASAMLNDNDRLFNNSFFAGGTSAFVQDLHEYDFGITKRTASGSQINLRSKTLYDANNAPVNTFPSYWESILEAEVRQPLLQGAGVEFNRIAGPGSLPGVYNGILIAKANNDINQHEFQAALRDYLSNVENAYWDLYFSYRVLDARKKAMEQAKRVAVAKDASEERDEEVPQKSLALQQYYEFKADFREAVTGRVLQGTQTRNGSSGGTLQGVGGVLTAERRLRLLIGLPASEERLEADGAKTVLLRPDQEPPMASVEFDWATISQEALTQRAELRRQQAVVRKREMELLAAENFLNPKLDAVARYRVRGLGDDLFQGGPNRGNAPNSSFGNLMTGDHQEYLLGFELEVPLGYRRGHAAVANAEFYLAQARAIHKEQQREVISNLSGSVADAVRAHEAIENALNQYLAADDYLKLLEARQRAGLPDSIDLVLDAQVRMVESAIRFFRARAEYAVSLKNIQLEKGTMLHYANLQMVGDSEPSPIAPAEPLPIPAAPIQTAPIESAPAEIKTAPSEPELAPPPMEVLEAKATEVENSGWQSVVAEQADSESIQQAKHSFQSKENEVATLTSSQEIASSPNEEDFATIRLNEEVVEEKVIDEVHSVSESVRLEVGSTEELLQEQRSKSFLKKLKLW